MRVQVGDLVQIQNRGWEGLFQLDPYLVVESCKHGNIKCRNLITGGEWTIHWKHVRPLTEENIEEAQRSFENKVKQVHEEMNNFLDKFK